AGPWRDRHGRAEREPARDRHRSSGSVPVRRPRNGHMDHSGRDARILTRKSGHHDRGGRSAGDVRTGTPSVRRNRSRADTDDGTSTAFGNAITAANGPVATGRRWLTISTDIT